MAEISALIRSLDDLLDPEAFDDMGPNGLQVPGPREIDRIVTGVTAQRELFERAAQERAQLVLVHHGLFWNFAPVGLTPLLAERLRRLFRHDIALAAYHLPLDAHPEVGNNALLAEALGAAGHVAFAGIGRGATFEEPLRRRSCSRASLARPAASRSCSTPGRRPYGGSRSSPAARRAGSTGRSPRATTRS